MCAFSSLPQFTYPCRVFPQRGNITAQHAILSATKRLIFTHWSSVNVVYAFRFHFFAIPCCSMTFWTVLFASAVACSPIPASEGHSKLEVGFKKRRIPAIFHELVTRGGGVVSCWGTETLTNPNFTNPYPR